MSAVTINNSPDCIYLIVGDLPEGEWDFEKLHEVLWCADRQGPHDLAYVPNRTIDATELQRRKRRVTSEFLAASGVPATGRTLAALHTAFDAMVEGVMLAGPAVSRTEPPHEPSAVCPALTSSERLAIGRAIEALKADPVSVSILEALLRAAPGRTATA